MADKIVLSNPAIRVNNLSVGFKPNSLVIKTGKGENSVKGVSEGGGNSGIAKSENVETRVGMIKFSLFSTNIDIESFNVWKSINISIGNIIKVIDENFNATMSGAIVINDPDIAMGVDESFEVEFEGGVIIEFS